METDYSKYYFLEKYLFEEVRENFNKRGYLLPEEFFCIVIWKANRRKTEIREKFPKDRKRLKETIKEITGKIHQEKDKSKQLEIILKVGLKYGFRLSIASAILTVLYPKEFTIYDYRVLSQLNAGKKKEEKIKDFSYSKNVIKNYFDFLQKVKKFAKNKNLSLRNADRYLWGESFSKDLEKLIELSEVLKIKLSA